MIDRHVIVGSFLYVVSSHAALADDVREYGEYLSGECTTCHRLDGSDTGIPSIVGWNPEDFVEVMQYYKAGERGNPAMISVARSLDPEQLQALAAYFGSIEAKE